MLSVSERYLQSVVADSRDMPYRVTLVGIGVYDRSKVPNMTLEESVGGTAGIELGTANSATLRLTIKNADPIDYNNMLVIPESGLVLPDGSIEWVPLGVFWVTDSTTSNDYKTLNLTCSDGMYNMSGEYISSLTYPTTIKAVVAEIVAQAGVEFEGIDSLPDIPVRRRLEGATHRTAIGYAAGCCGKNARFNRHGKLEFTWYNDTGRVIGREIQYLDGMTKLNNARLSVGFDITGQKETYSVEVISDGNGGVVATPGQGVYENDKVVLSISPLNGYELATLVAIAETGEDISLYKNSEGGYDFIQPDSNVVVTASFRKDPNGPFELTTRAHDGGTITQEPSSHDAGDNYFNEGDVATVTIVPDDGKQIDRVVTTPGNLEYTQNGSSYSFTMPKSDVTFTVYFKDADVVITPYSWLKKPIAPPSTKPYWAMFYKDDPNLPTCQKYYLVWFDSWSASLYDTAYDLNEYKITLNGYYYCGSKSNGNGAHEWDGSVWTGNGDPASSVKWNSYCGFMWSGAENNRIDQQYCLIVSNVDLLRNGSVVFEANESDITDVQTSYIQDGMDVRERGSLSYWMCPDTFSTPLPSPHWMVLMPESGLYMTVGDDGKYKTPLTSYPSTMIVLFYDSISVRNIGVVENQSSEEFYIASVTNGRWAYLRSENLGWDELHELPEGAVIGFRNPLISTESEYVYNDGNSYQFAGVLATNTTLYVGGSVFMHNNACRVCDCVSSERVAMFARRSVASNLIPEDSIEIADIQATADGDAIILYGVTARSFGDSLELIPTNPTEKIKISYTNPMIYEKMIPYIESVVQGITYTPAKVKHRGNPAFQAGDIVKVPDSTGLAHAILIMQQRMVFGGGMNAEITCPGQTQKTKNFSSNSLLNNQIAQEVQRSNEELEHRLSVNNSLVYASIYRSIGISEAEIKLLTERQTEEAATVAEIKQTVSDHEASIKTLTEWQGTASESLASVEQKATDNEASIKSLTEWKGTTNTAIAEVTQKATDNEASIKSLTEWQGTTNTALSEVKQKADDNEASIKTLTEWKGTTSTSLATIEQTVGEHSASIKTLTEWKGTASDSLATVEQKATDNEASIKSLTEWKGTTNTTLATIEQRVSDNEATIELLSKWEGEGAESLAEIVQKVNANEASITSLTEWKGTTSESLAKVEQTVGEHSSSIETLTYWSNYTLTTVSSIQQTVSKDKAAIELLVEYDSEGNPKTSASLIIEAINGESSAKIKADRLDIEGKTLNIKVASTNITGKLTAKQIDVLGGLTCTATEMSGTSANGNVTIISPGVVNVKNSEGLGFFASGSEVRINAADGYFMKVQYKGKLYGLSISNGSVQATNITNE